MATPSFVCPLVAALPQCQQEFDFGGFLILPDDTICALAQLFCNGISVINHEVLIEDLEDLPPGEVTHDCRCSKGR